MQRQPVKEVSKDASMVKQKEMIGATTDRLTSAAETGGKVAATFVPGNLNELIMCFDLARSLPEINALQNGLRKKSGKLHHGSGARRPFRGRLHLRQVRPRHDGQGQDRPTGEELPKPDVLLLSYTGCFTFMKWFELMREQVRLRDGRCCTCPTRATARSAEHARVHGQAAEGRGDPDARAHLGRQVRHRPAAPVHARIGQGRGRSGHGCCRRAKDRPSPIDAYFGAVYYIGPIFTAFRGTPEATDYYRVLREEIEERMREGKGPMTPEGDMGEEKYRLVVEGPPNWTSFREFWKMFYDEGAVVVASHLHQGRRRVRLRLPPRSGPPARVAGRLLPRLLHQPAACRRAST